MRRAQPDRVGEDESQRCQRRQAGAARQHMGCFLLCASSLKHLPPECEHSQRQQCGQIDRIQDRQIGQGIGHTLGDEACDHCPDIDQPAKDHSAVPPIGFGIRV